MAAVNSDPFQPAGTLGRWMMMLVIVAVVAVLFVLVGMHHDELGSRINKASPDRSLWSLDFFSKLLTYVAPIVALLATLTYGFYDALMVVLGPFLR